MNTIHLTDLELKTARQGMEAFLQGFTHHEADTLHAIRAVIARLDEAQVDESGDALTR